MSTASRPLGMPVLPGFSVDHVRSSASPLLADQFVVSGAVQAAAVWGDVIFVGLGVGVESEIQAVRRTDTGGFETVQAMRVPGSVYGLAASEQRLYAAVRYEESLTAGQLSGLVVIDVSNLRNLRVERTVPLPGDADTVLVKGGAAYVSCGRAGLVVVDAAYVEGAGRLLYLPVLWGQRVTGDR